MKLVKEDERNKLRVEERGRRQLRSFERKYIT
jgi:hypothetical protein